ncbi:hypothetical protein Tco_0583326 [Tanacetum coccineum]
MPRVSALARCDNNMDMIAMVSEVITMISEVNLVGSNNSGWWVDIGATRHVCAGKSMFHSFRTVDNGEKLYMGNSATADIKGEGDVILKMTSDKELKLTIILKQLVNLIYKLNESLKTRTYKIKIIQKESIESESHKSSTQHSSVNDFVVIDIPEEDVEPKQIILDPDDQPMWESAKTVAPTPNSAIVQPNVDDNFVINSTHLNMIRENKFDGYLRADPHDHIREFLAICNMFKYGETQSEAVKLLIFPYFPTPIQAKTLFKRT